MGKGSLSRCPTLLVRTRESRICGYLHGNWIIAVGSILEFGKGRIAYIDLHTSLAVPAAHRIIIQISGLFYTCYIYQSWSRSFGR
ncbi:hypothetical protein B0H66DRAFT_550891 [Apodospora peruviana]|uniref:Uncharacterized protein n=1 Tax=Apodospora peruviana TaxID=516989 RepID=A0AAE0IK05_9PEZI|nr:hypothetical protein B0H66DRAFT_550891 [Apodospora peruviana]